MSNSSNNDFEIFEVAILNYINTVVFVQSCRLSVDPWKNVNKDI